MKGNSVHTVWIGLGTNLGNRRINLIQACELITSLDCRISNFSSIYESAPWGFNSEHSFYNQCIIIETVLNHEDLLRSLKMFEVRLGRVHSVQGYEDRIIDIDILFFDDLIFDSDHLKIPHPGIAIRSFVLKPLVEISPDKMHPVLKKTLAELFEICEDQEKVHRLPDK